MTYNKYWNSEQHYKNWVLCWNNLQVGDVLVYEISYNHRKHRKFRVDSFDRNPKLTEITDPNAIAPLVFTWPVDNFWPPDKIIKKHSL